MKNLFIYLLLMYYGIKLLIELKNTFNWFDFIILLITFIITTLLLKKESEK